MTDLIIIGGGPAGLTAAIYGARAGLETVLIERMFFGGQAATTFEIDNYPGLPGISGPELAAKLEDQARRFQAGVINGEVLTVELEGTEGVKHVRTSDTDYKARAVIIATGARPRRLGVPGEDVFMGRGVSYCATCDGAFYRGKRVAVAGGGDTALEDAIYLSGLCEKVYLIHRRDEFRANASLVNRIGAFSNIEPVLNSRITEILGSDTDSGVPSNLAGVERIRVKGAETAKKTEPTDELAVAAVFIAVGSIPNSELFRDKLEMNDGRIVTDRFMQTRIPGVYAAGDVTDTPLRQIVTACADGAVAAKSASEYIRGL